MSDTTPTPREREAARELAVDIIYHLKSNNVIWNEMAMDVIVPRIAAALARERREAQAEQMERDCKAVCEMCKDVDVWRPACYGSSVENGPMFWHHVAMPDCPIDWHIRECYAAPIRAAAIEALRE